MKIKSILLAASVTAALMANASAVFTVVYQDSFSRTSNLSGTAPDVVNTNGNLWQSQQNGPYTTDGSTAGQSGNFGSIYLPVNGSSGVILDGTADFVLSVDIITSSGPQMGIALNSAVYNGGNQYSGNSTPGILAALGTGGSGQTTAIVRSGTVFAGNQFGGSNTATLAITYSEANDTLTFTKNGLQINGGSGGITTGVTATDILALNFISLNNGAFAANTGRFDNLTLSIDLVPEPSTAALLFAGLSALVCRRGKRRELADSSKGNSSGSHNPAFRFDPIHHAASDVYPRISL